MIVTSALRGMWRQPESLPAGAASNSGANQPLEGQQELSCVLWKVASNVGCRLPVAALAQVLGGFEACQMPAIEFRRLDLRVTPRQVQGC